MRIIMAVLIILIAVPAMSAVMHVTNSQEFQVALTAAANNGESDTILLAEGTYNGGFSHLSMENYDLTIQAEDGLTAENVIIDGGGLYRVLNLVSLNYQTTVTLNNLTVQNGSQAVHGGLYVETGGDIVITDCVFHSNAGGQTVAVYGKASSDRSVSFQRNIVRNNSSGAYSSQNSGAAVSLSILARGTMLVEDNVISDNSVRASTGAGGLDISNSGFATVRRNTIRNNVGGSFAAGGFHIFNGSVTFSDNTVQGNSSQNGPGVNFSSILSANINGNVISGNTTVGGWVAGLFLRTSGGGGSVISNNLIFDNDNLSTNTSYHRTGGIYVDNQTGGTQSIILTNNTITGNSSYAAAGVKANIVQGSYVYMYNNIVWGNGDSGQGSVDIILEGFGTKVGFNNNYSTLTGLWGNYADNIDANPDFAGGGDYHLQAGSACINTGNSLAPGIPPLDIEGLPRIMGGGVDMGAYEALDTLVPVALFSASPLTGQAPLAVTFQDASFGNISSRLWAFGDGATSTEQHPVHTYTSAGSYNVTLTVTGSEGSDSESKTAFISVSMHPPVASAGIDRSIAQQSFTFNGAQSSDPDGSVVSYQWHLVHRTDTAYNQDATGVSPTVSALHSGFYDVTLTVTDNNGLTGSDTMVLAVSSPWDVGSDGQTGLEEAIHILRTLSGL